MQVLEISRAEITRAHLIDAAPASLSAGEVRLKLVQFALTANNVTYAATGEVIGYWDFFPASDPGQGRLPVWGIAEVIESASEISEGERVFGFFPMAEEVTALPGRIRDTAWTDTSPHRKGLPPVYNDYFRLSGLPGHEIGLEDRMGLLYPLYATSFVLADFLYDHAWFGAEQIVVGSASSKTAIGLMQLVSEYENAPALIGLTSTGNRDFVAGLGVCADVLTYDRVAEGLSARASVYVDFSGNTEIRRAVHTTLDESLAYSCAVGLSHWDKFEQGAEMPGPQPQFFFAPAQVKKRREEWGPGIVEGRIMEAWRRLARDHTGWLMLRHHRGLATAAEIYRDLAQGQIAPSDGHIVSL
ncbi:MAG: DUF2855 family protein [Pseudomonadota bacterium]